MLKIVQKIKEIIHRSLPAMCFYWFEKSSICKLLLVDYWWSQFRRNCEDIADQKICLKVTKIFNFLNIYFYYLKLEYNYTLHFLSKVLPVHCFAILSSWPLIFLSLLYKHIHKILNASIEPTQSIQSNLYVYGFRADYLVLDNQFRGWKALSPTFSIL